jgi:hypothetical protein
MAPEQAEWTGKRPCQDEREEAGSDINPSECIGSSHNTDDEDGEEDEEPRPAKRRKRDSQLTRQIPVEVEHAEETARAVTESISGRGVPVKPFPWDGAYVQYGQALERLSDSRGSE